MVGWIIFSLVGGHGGVVESIWDPMAKDVRVTVLAGRRKEIEEWAEKRKLQGIKEGLVKNL